MWLRISKPNKACPPQVSFGHDVEHNTRKYIYILHIYIIWFIHLYMHHTSYFIHSFTDGHLGWLYNLAIVNNNHSKQGFSSLFIVW